MDAAHSSNVDVAILLCTPLSTRGPRMSMAFCRLGGKTDNLKVATNMLGKAPVGIRTTPSRGQRRTQVVPMRKIVERKSAFSLQPTVLPFHRFTFSASHPASVLFRRLFRTSLAILYYDPFLTFHDYSQAVRSSQPIPALPLLFKDDSYSCVL